MKWLFIALSIFGSMASLAWYGAEEPKQTAKQKRAYGILAVSTWVILLILGNTLL
jgi:hypothetical protein